MVRAPGRLVGAIELMDLADADPAELHRALRDLARINRWFGGARLVLRHLAPFLRGRGTPVRMLDVGTGFADVPRAIARWARRQGLSVTIEGLDHHDRILALAREACAPYPEIRLRQADALSLPYPEGSFEVALASLLLHHMEAGEQVRLLRELYRVARRAVLVNDLRRGSWPFLATWMSLHVLSPSRLIRHDGPLSVRRAFLPGELLALAREAGWEHARVSRHAFFRLALVGEKS
jgi:hypothetical protein